jgi:hypothetical protein
VKARLAATFPFVLAAARPLAGAMLAGLASSPAWHPVRNV